MVARKKFLEKLIQEEVKTLFEDTVSDMHVVHLLLDQDEIEHARVPLRRAVNSLSKDDDGVLHTEKKSLTDGREAYHFYVRDAKAAKILKNLIRSELRYAGVQGFDTVTKQQFGGMVGFMRPERPKRA